MKPIAANSHGAGLHGTLDKILISACLLGEAVRYDGKSLLCEHPLIQLWLQEGRLVAVCPEVSGGLTTPRPPAEIIVHTEPSPLNGGQAVLTGAASVQTQGGEDVSAAFMNGAQDALKLCQQQRISLALLSARSPSCGNEHIYNGQFNKTLISGMGVTATLLTQAGIKVFNQFQIEALAQQLNRTR